MDKIPFLRVLGITHCLLFALFFPLYRVTYIYLEETLGYGNHFPLETLVLPSFAIFFSALFIQLLLYFRHKRKRIGVFLSGFAFVAFCALYLFSRYLIEFDFALRSFHTYDLILALVFLRDVILTYALWGAFLLLIYSLFYSWARKWLKRFLIFIALYYLVAYLL